MTLPLGNLGPPLDTPGYAEAPPLPSALFDAEHFRFLAEASTDGILVNRSGYYVYANPAAAALFKASGPEQLVGKRPFDLIHPDDHALVTARYASVLHGASMPLQEIRAVTTGGETIWVETTAACYYGTDGPSVLIIFRDITERKKTNALIRASEAKLRQALLASNTGLWEWDTQANEVQFSREWKSQLGYEDAELPDRFETWKERLHPDDRFRVLAYVQQYLAHPQGEYQQEFRLRHKDDSYRWIEARASFVTETDGRRVRLLGSHTDITARKQAEEAARRLVTIVESSEDAIISKSVDGLVTSWNHGAKRLFGYQAEEMIGQPITKLFPPDRLDEEEQIREQLKQGKTLKHYETVRLTKNGEPRHVSLAISPMRDKHGTVVGFSKIVRDITEQKQAEAQLLELNTRLATMSSHLELVREEEQRRLANDLHDELGHQLTAGKLDVAFLEQLTQRTNDSDGPALAETIGRLRQTLDRAIASVRKIARQARPDSLDRLGLVATLEALVDDVRDHAGIHAHFTSAVDEERFAPGKALEVALYRVTQEALTNVVRHSGATSVNVQLREENGVALLEIKDNGKGFDQSLHDPNLSIGLRGMKERLEMVGGRFSIVGRQGCGTVVTVTANIPTANIPVRVPCQTS